MITTLLLLVSVASCFAEDCDGSKYKKIGCFKRANSILIEEIFDKTDESFDLDNYHDNLPKLVCQCFEQTKDNYRYFAVGKNGHCFAGEDFETTSEQSGDCIGPAEHHQGGLENAEYVYQMRADAATPKDGGESDFGPWGDCSASCGGGKRSRERACVNPLPNDPGKGCDKLTEVEDCNTHHCPIDGGFTDWSAYEACDKPCGGGIQTKTRSCTNPAPQYGGNECVGATSESQSCNTHHCPIDGGISLWSSYGACTKTCGGGIQTKTRSCTNPAPQYGGKGCSESKSETKTCNTHICLTSSNLESKIKSTMQSNNGQSNDNFRNTLKNALASTYLDYYFTVDSYGKASGFDNHAVIGHYYKYVFRQYGRNVVVGYAKKTSTVPSSSKRSEIEKAVEDAVTKKGRAAKTSAELAWAKATSYGYPIAMVHVVRFGNGLRSAGSGYWTFDNFVCDRSCNWLNSCTNHESSVVIMFGSG